MTNKTIHPDVRSMAAHIETMNFNFPFVVRANPQRQNNNKGHRNSIGSIEIITSIGVKLHLTVLYGCDVDMYIRTNNHIVTGSDLVHEAEFNGFQQADIFSDAAKTYRYTPNYNDPNDHNSNKIIFGTTEKKNFESDLVQNMDLLEAIYTNHIEPEPAPEPAPAPKQGELAEDVIWLESYSLSELVNLAESIAIEMKERLSML